MSDFLGPMAALGAAQRVEQMRKNHVLDHMFEGSMEKKHRLRDDEIDMDDPDQPGYREAAPKGERPSKRAQWDDVRNCWVEWSKDANDWVEVPPKAADPPVLDEVPPSS